MERHLELNVQPMTAYNGVSVMVLAGISTNKTYFFVVPDTPNGHRYINEILRPNVVPYLRQLGPNSIFKDDNARPHRARMVDDFLRQDGVVRMNWPPVSPDLACIAHICGILWRAVNKRITQQPRLADIPGMLRQEWGLKTQQQLQRLVYSKRRRLTECNVHRGGYTNY